MLYNPRLPIPNTILKEHFLSLVVAQKKTHNHVSELLSLFLNLNPQNKLYTHLFYPQTNGYFNTHNMRTIDVKKYLNHSH